MHDTVSGIADYQSQRDALWDLTTAAAEVDGVPLWGRNLSEPDQGLEAARQNPSYSFLFGNNPTIGPGLSALYRQQLAIQYSCSIMLISIRSGLSGMHQPMRLICSLKCCLSRLGIISFTTPQRMDLPRLRTIPIGVAMLVA